MVDEELGGVRNLSTPGIAKIENRADLDVPVDEFGELPRCLISAIRRSYKLDSGFATMPLAPIGSFAAPQVRGEIVGIPGFAQSGACGPTLSSRSHKLSPLGPGKRTSDIVPAPAGHPCTVVAPGPALQTRSARRDNSLH